MLPPLPARPARSETASSAADPFCAICDAHAWTEVERRSRSPVGSGTRLSCQMCGAHRIVASDDDAHRVVASDDDAADADDRTWIEFVDPSGVARGWPGSPLSN